MSPLHNLQRTDLCINIHRYMSCLPVKYTFARELSCSTFQDFVRYSYINLTAAEFGLERSSCQDLFTASKHHHIHPSVFILFYQLLFFFYKFQERNIYSMYYWQDRWFKSFYINNRSLCKVKVAMKFLDSAQLSNRPCFQPTTSRCCQL